MAKRIESPYSLNGTPNVSKADLVGDAARRSGFAACPLLSRYDVQQHSYRAAAPALALRGEPVASRHDAGADVLFVDNPPPCGGDRGLGEALDKLGRPTDRYTIGWNGPMPSFDGYWWLG